MIYLELLQSSKLEGCDEIIDYDILGGKAYVLCRMFVR